MSKLIFVCPNTATTVTKLASSNALRPLYENLWLVSRQSYERCAVNQTTDSELILCDKPFNLKYYTVIFKKYSAGVDLKFEPGKEYYFIGKKNQLIDLIFSILFLPSPLPSLTEHLTLNKGEGWSGGGGGTSHYSLSLGVSVYWLAWWRSLANYITWDPIDISARWIKASFLRLTKVFVQWLIIFFAILLWLR